MYLLICSIAENTVILTPCQIIFLISAFLFKKKKKIGGTLKLLNFTQR